jgi:hypothetical protein
MLFLEIISEALAQTVGGMVATAAIVFLTWTPFKVIGRPEWGPALALLILTVAYVERVTNSPLLPMTLIMLLPTALAAWWEGYEWRRSQKLRKLFDIVPPPSRPLYWRQQSLHSNG